MSTGAGYIGLLSNSAQKRENRRLETEAMLRMEQRNTIENEKEIKAQALEQEYYANLNKEADELLAPDKANINRKALLLQSNIREQIKQYGGSRAKFMENGGVSILGNYINSVIGSEEMATFKNNKKNMVKILDALSDPKLSALITKKDLKSMRAYEQNGYGEITYSGLLPDLTMPDANSFDYGSEIADEKIIQHGNNFNALKARMVMEEMYDDPNNISDAAVYQYFKTLNISLTGKNLEKIRIEEETKRHREEQRTKYNIEALKNNENKENKDNVLLSTQLLSLSDEYGTFGITNEEILNWESQGTFDKNFKERTGLKTNIGQNNIPESKITKLDYVGTTELSLIVDLFGNANWGDDRYSLAGAKLIYPKVEQGLIDALGGGYTLVDGKMLYTPSNSSNAYHFNGTKEKIHSKEKLYTPVGVYSAFKTVANGKESLLTIKTDSKGIKQRNLEKNIHDNGKGTNKLVYVIGLRDPDGIMTYEELDITNQQVREIIKNSVKSDDISATVAEERDTELKKQTIKENQRIINETDQKVIGYYSKNVFDTEYARNTFRQYDTPGTEITKAKVLKGLTVALTELYAPKESKKSIEGKTGWMSNFIQSNNIPVFLESSGLTQEFIQNFKGTPNELIDTWLKKANHEYRQGTPSDKKNMEENYATAELWKKFIEFF